MFAIAPTDIEWFDYLKENLSSDKINFWTPTPWNVRQLKEGDKLYFLLKSPSRKIGGFGYFSYYENMTAKQAWNRFGINNGVKSLLELVNRCTKYVNKNSIFVPTENPAIGCIVLENPTFLDEEEFFLPEQHGLSFPTQVVKLKYFHQEDIKLSIVGEQKHGTSFELVGSNKKQYQSSKTKKRRGQPQFRKTLLEAYSNKCCITGEICLDVLQASHIQEYISEKSNHVQNGLVLRVDLHRLFDSGLISIDTDYKVSVSPLLDSTYYRSLNGKTILLPKKIEDYPSKEALSLHKEIVFRNEEI